MSVVIKRWNGTGYDELYPKTTVAMIVASGTPSSSNWLRGDSTWNAPTAAQVGAEPSFTTLGVSKGGTGAGTFTTGEVLVGNGTSSISTLSRSGIDSRTTFPVALAASGTRGGVQLGFTSTETNRALLLSSEQGYISLPRQIPACTLNNVGNTSPSWYAPTAGGTTGQILLGNGSTSAPVWGTTMTTIIAAQNNTSYTTKQIRNITLSTSDASGGDNGDVWIKYTA